MSCYYPLKRWVIGYDPSRDIDIVKVTSYDTDAVKGMNGHVVTKFQEIPCGKCIGCRLQYSREWATRCMLEAQKHDNNQFITLTYDDDHLPLKEGVVNFDTGEVGLVPTLVPKALSDFVKRLRRKLGYHFNFDNVRFFGCGEYGEEKMRPHYHLIIFNCPLPDKKYFYTASNGTDIYRSKIIEDCWPCGISSVCDVTWETCAYVARYVVKKQKGKEAVDLFKSTGREQEFVRMSRRPGIARDWYEDNKDKLYLTDELFIRNNKGVQKVKPARYFDKIYDLDNPERMKVVKEARKKVAEYVQIEKEAEYGLKKTDYLKLEEEHKLSQIRALKRRLK